MTHPLQHPPTTLLVRLPQPQHPRSHHLYHYAGNRRVINPRVHQPGSRPQGNLPEAEALYRQSLTIAQQLADRLGPTHTQAQRELMMALIRVANYAHEQDDSVEAKSLYSQSLTIAEAVFKQTGDLKELRRAAHVSGLIVSCSLAVDEVVSSLATSYRLSRLVILGLTVSGQAPDPNDVEFAIMNTAALAEAAQEDPQSRFNPAELWQEVRDLVQRFPESLESSTVQACVDMMPPAEQGGEDRNPEN